MSEDIDTLIARKESDLSPLLENMEQLRCKFVEKTIRFASEWYKRTAKEYVTKCASVTLGMKEEKIARMKSQVNELVQNAEKTVKSEFENPALWWHLNPSLHDWVDKYLQVADKYPEILDRAVRHVLGRLGFILEEYNFNVYASAKAGSYREFWFDKPLGDGTVSVPSYPHLLKWSDEMQVTIQDYSVKYVKALGLFSELQGLKEEKKRNEALALWGLHLA